jgi:hypothetical protein
MAYLNETSRLFLLRLRKSICSVKGRVWIIGGKTLSALVFNNFFNHSTFQDHGKLQFLFPLVLPCDHK